MKLTPNQRKIVEYARQNDNTIRKKQACEQLLKQTICIMNNNYINGKQYPYGFKDWLRKVSFHLMDRYGCFKDTPRCNAWKRLDSESYFPLFMDGLHPVTAAEVSMKE